MELVKLMTEPEYRKVEAISYSMLSGVDKTPASLINDRLSDSDGIKYGSAVDTLTFDGEEAFKQKFAVYSGKSSSKMIEDIIKDVIAIIQSDKGEVKGKLEDYEKTILQSAKAFNYGQSWKDDTRLRKIKEEGGSDLFDFLIESEGKLILDTLEYQNVINTSHTLYTHPFSSKWFTANEDEDIVFQFPILWIHNGNKCKSLFDTIKIDHKNKIIYPLDLKTSYDHVLGFKKNFLKCKYYLQASFYSKALSYWKLENGLRDYKIDNFRFIIISSQNPYKPLVYKCSDNDLLIGRHGGYYNGNKIKGFETLIEDLKWHKQTQQYDYPREIYEGEGEVMLDIFDRVE